MKIFTFLLLSMVSWSIQAETSTCLEEKGHYIFGLMGLKSKAYLGAKNAAKINEKYDILEMKRIQLCEEDEEQDCSDVADDLHAKKQKEMKGHLSRAFGDMSWCDNPDIIDNMKYMRDAKVKYCRLVDAKRETEIGESFNSLENEWDDGEFGNGNDCPSSKVVLETFKRVPIKTLHLPVKQLCHAVFKKMQVIVSKCEAKRNSK